MWNPDFAYMANLESRGFQGEYSSSYESENPLSIECEKIGGIIAQLLMLANQKSRDSGTVSRGRFQFHVGHNRWISVEATHYEEKSPERGELVRAFTVQMGESGDLPRREWIINELSDTARGVYYRPFFHDYARARTEFLEREGFVSPEYESVDDPDAADLREACESLECCLEKLKQGTPDDLKAMEFSFHRDG